MQRRSIIATIAGLAAAAAFAVPATGVAAPHALAEFATAPSRRTGALYLQAFPGEADAAMLERLLFANGLPLSAEAIRQEIASASFRDFSRSDVVVIDRWVLARSEARVSALAYLTVCA